MLNLTSIGTNRVEGTFHVAGSTLMSDTLAYTIDGHIGHTVTVAGGASAGTFATAVSGKTESTGVEASSNNKAEGVGLSGAGNISLATW